MNIGYDSLFCCVNDFYTRFKPWYQNSSLTIDKCYFQSELDFGQNNLAQM